VTTAGRVVRCSPENNSALLLRTTARVNSEADGNEEEEREGLGSPDAAAISGTAADCDQSGLEGSYFDVRFFR
jgi:hypothetical protein